MEDNKILKLVYTFFLGILLALFIGAGVNTFYPSPEAPEYPIELQGYQEKFTAEQQEIEKQHEAAMRDYEDNQLQPYNRNVSIITLIAAVALLVISIIFESRMKVIADGVMLGGLFTLLYSIGRGFASNDSKYAFAVITVGLILVLYLGYHRFVKHDTKVKTTAKTAKVKTD